MKIKFLNEIYNLYEPPNVTQTHFQASIKKDDYDLSSLVDEINESNTIIIYDDDDTELSVLTGFTKPVAISCMFSDNTIVSVELENEDVFTMINTLSEKVESINTSNSALTITFANISSLPTTVYNDSVTSDMVVTGKEFSNSEAVIENMKTTIVDGSVTISGTITGTTDITLYLTKAIK